MTVAKADVAEVAVSKVEEAVAKEELAVAK